MQRPPQAVQSAIARPQGIALAVAGLSMIAPVPMISFDNVLPALAMLLIVWGLRLRDGLMLLAGYSVSFLAVVSVVGLWWGGTHLASEMLVGFGLPAGP